MGRAIRRFELEDEAALRHVMVKSLDFDAFPGFSAGDLEAETVSMLADRGRILLAEEDGVVCGCFGPKQEDLTVHPDYRRRGHGRRLFEAGLPSPPTPGSRSSLCTWRRPGRRKPSRGRWG